MSKKNTDNLISLADRPEEERKAIATAGGKASGAARREAAGFRDKIRLLARTKIDYCNYSNTRMDEILADKLFMAAIGGNMKAVALIMDVLGNDSDDRTDWRMQADADNLETQKTTHELFKDLF